MESDLDGVAQSVLQPHHETYGIGHGPQITSLSKESEVVCGPLLNYKHMSNQNTPSPRWHGSVLLVTKPGQQQPSLQLRCLGSMTSDPGTDTLQEASSGMDHGRYKAERPSEGITRSFLGEKLYEDIHSEFWRFSFDLPLSSVESKWEYHIPKMRHLSGASGPRVSTKIFHVPPSSESMRIMFHSCNGFSVGTDEDAWSGCALWNDVLRSHTSNPIHVMIGGGDQIYNDGIRVDGPLRAWCDIGNPIKRREYPFTEQLRAECDKYYFDSYVKWYSTEPFASANGTIPQINIWDDHDIIDGFGSYTDHFMKCAVFRGIGGVAHKYYLLFQHHVPPPTSTFTTDAPSTMNGNDDRPDSAQLKQAFIMTDDKEDPSYIIGPKPGPYVEERSRSVYCELGAHIAFLGIDARTERTRHQINYPETYDVLLRHVDREISRSAGRIKHFILLLGVPIAYPRLQWLENIFQSPLIGAIRLLNKRFGVAGGLFNNFDGNVDLMDDLDDHYTAHQHKKERKDLILRLQNLAEKHSVRVTILGGDVHLAALGRFYSKPGLNLSPAVDHRYIPNIISSAITNHPPPTAVANLLARRNKIHHLDHQTDETLLNLFDKDPGEKANPQIKKKSANNNHCTMPSRNYALIAESHDYSSAAIAAGDGASSSANGAPVAPQEQERKLHQRHHNLSRKPGNPRNPLHAGEDNCGVEHPAASGTNRTGLGGRYGLDVTFRVEIDQHDREGKTDGYGFSIPGLDVRRK